MACNDIYRVNEVYTAPGTVDAVRFRQWSSIVLRALEVRTTDTVTRPNAFVRGCLQGRDAERIRGIYHAITPLVLVKRESVLSIASVAGTPVVASGDSSRYLVDAYEPSQSFP